MKCRGIVFGFRPSSTRQFALQREKKFLRRFKLIPSRNCFFKGVKRFNKDIDFIFPKSDSVSAEILYNIIILIEPLILLIGNPHQIFGSIITFIVIDMMNLVLVNYHSW